MKSFAVIFALFAILISVATAIPQFYPGGGGGFGGGQSDGKTKHLF